MAAVKPPHTHVCVAVADLCQPLALATVYRRHITVNCTLRMMCTRTTVLSQHTHLLVAVAELCHVAKVYICNAAVTQAEDVARVWVTVEQAKLQQLPQA
jgi:hypothetical protein